MSPMRGTPEGSAIARIALRRVAVPVEHPRVFPVFEEMFRKALAAGDAGTRPAPARSLDAAR